MSCPRLSSCPGDCWPTQHTRLGRSVCALRMLAFADIPMTASGSKMGNPGKPEEGMYIMQDLVFCDAVCAAVEAPAPSTWARKIRLLLGATWVGAGLPDDLTSSSWCSARGPDGAPVAAAKGAGACCGDAHRGEVRCWRRGAMRW